MCEFEVVLNGETVYKDVIYAKTEGKNVIVKDILGAVKKFENCYICLLYTSPSPRDLSTSRMPSSA